MRSIFALVNAETLGFSRRARGGRTVKPEMPTMRQSSSEQIQRLGGLLGEADDAFGIAVRGVEVSCAHLAASSGACQARRRMIAALLGELWTLAVRAAGSMRAAAVEADRASCAIPTRWSATSWRRPQPARDGPRLHDAALARSAHRLRFAVLKGFGAHRDLEPMIYEFFEPLGDARPSSPRSHGVRRQRAQRVLGSSASPSCCTLSSHDPEGRGQLQLPVARGAAAQLRRGASAST